MISLNLLAESAVHVSEDANLIEQIVTELHLKPELFWPQVATFAVVLFVVSKFGIKPLVAVLEERKQKIIEIEEKSEAIKGQLADAEAEKAAVISKANEDASRIVAEAKTSAEKIAETKQAEAETSAASIVARAEQQAQADKDAATAEIKAHFGKLLASATTAVTGKVLTDEDQSRINEEAATSVKN